MIYKLVIKLKQLLAELFRLHSALTIFSLVMIGLAIPTLVLMHYDLRYIRGVSVWMKPLRFLLSSAIISVVNVWYLGLLSKEVRESKAIKTIAWAAIATSSIEILYISFQASLAEGSHYYISDPLHALLFKIMALLAFTLGATPAGFAYMYIKHTKIRPYPIYTLAVIIGLITSFIFVEATGVMLGTKRPQAGAGMPLTSWHIIGGGDLRPAHFLAVHAQWIIPLFGFWIGRFKYSSAKRGLYLFSLVYALVWLYFAILGKMVGWIYIANFY